MDSCDHQTKMMSMLAPEECRDPDCGSVYVRLAHAVERIRAAKESIARLKKTIADERALGKERKHFLLGLDWNVSELRDRTKRGSHKASDAILINLAFLIRMRRAKKGTRLGRTPLFRLFILWKEKK